MKCYECGNTGFTGSSCPDCGSGDVVEETGGAQAVPALLPPPPATLPVMPDPPDASAAMPDVGMSMTVTPLVGIIKLMDGSGVEMRDGDVFTVADEATDQDVTYRISGDTTVSTKPISVIVSGGRANVSGGGSNGFALDITLRFKMGGEVQVPKTIDEVIALLQGGASFAAVALKAGKDTRLPLKF